MFIGYIQDNNDQLDYADQYQKLLSFAKEHGFILGCVHAGDNFEKIKNIIPADCEGIIINKIGCIGPYLQNVKDNLQFCQKNNLKLFSIDDNYMFDKNLLTEDFFRGMNVTIDIRSQLISQATRKILSLRKKEGKKLGRPIGAKGRSKLDSNASEILRMLNSNISKSKIARRLGVSRASIYTFARKHGISFRRELKHV